MTDREENVEGPALGVSREGWIAAYALVFGADEATRIVDKIWKNLGDNPAHSTAPAPGLVALVALVNDRGKEVGEAWLPNGQLLEWQRRMAQEHEEVRNRFPHLLEKD